MDNNSRFQLKDARITRVTERPKVCFVGVICQAGKFSERFDVTCFQPPAFPLEEGLAVSITGDLSMRKPKEEGGRWELQLIARKWEKGDTEKAPWPRGGQRPAPKQEPLPVEDDGIPF